VKIEKILGYDVAVASVKECVEEISRWIEHRSNPRYCVCANPHSIELALNDDLFSQAMRSADLVIPDGIGVVWASRLLGGGITERVTGSDVFEGVCSSLNRRGGYKMFFLGSTVETLQDINARMCQRFPSLEVVGFYSPPFRDEFGDTVNAQMVEAVNLAQPDVLWVGMTAPKQEKWIFRNLAKLEVPAICAVGAVFDFLTGRVYRAPRALRQLGLEWLPRLIQEPRRMWRRNFVSNPKFVFKVINSRFKLASRHD